MTPAQRCDEIIRMIDEVLDGALHTEHAVIPAPPLAGPSIDLPLNLIHLERFAWRESRA